MLPLKLWNSSDFCIFKITSTEEGKEQESVWHIKWCVEARISLLKMKVSPVANSNGSQSRYNQKLQPSSSFLEDMNNWPFEVVQYSGQVLDLRGGSRGTCCIYTIYCLFSTQDWGTESSQCSADCTVQSPIDKIFCLSHFTSFFHSFGSV